MFRRLMTNRSEGIFSMKFAGWWKRRPISPRERRQSSSARCLADRALKMGRAFHTIVALAAVAGSLPGQSPPATNGSIIGTWEAVARSTGGLGSTITFSPDNSLSFTLGAMVDMTYKRVGDSLFVTSADGALPPASIKFENDSLIVDRGDREQREARIGLKGGGDPLVGRWTYQHYTGVAAYEEYTPTGEFHLRVPIRTLTGNFVVAGNTAVMHLMGDGGGDRTVNFSISGDTLQLTWNGQSTRYLRAIPLTR
jgi:hypothetical protein